MPQYPDYRLTNILKDTPGLIAWWPLDDTVSTKSYSRVLNPSASTGRNMVLNGTFDTNTIWTPQLANWTIASGVAHSDGTNVTTSNLSQTIPLVVGKAYLITFALLNRTAGSVRLFLGTGSTPTSRSVDGTYSETILCSGSSSLFIQASAGFIGDIDNVIVTQVNIPAYNATPTQLLADGDMEAAGTGSWTAVNSAILSKQTTSPHGGTQVLRIARNGVNNPGAAQIATVIGKKYHVTGFMRSDGTTTPNITDGGAGIGGTGTTSTSWQSVDTVYIAITTSFRFLVTNATVDGQYAEFDDITLTEISPLSGQPTNGVLLGQPTAPQGHLNYAYKFDGSNDFVNIYSSDLNSIFNPSEGALVAWATVASSGVWTDGATRGVVTLVADGNNTVEMRKEITNNNFSFYYISGGVIKSVTSTTMSSAGWVQFIVTWSKSSNQMKAYINGAQVGSTQTSLGTWSGNFDSSRTLVGSRTTAAANPWLGYINDVRLYSRALSAREIYALYKQNWLFYVSK